LEGLTIAFGNIITNAGKDVSRMVDDCRISINTKAKPYLEAALTAEKSGWKIITAYFNASRGPSTKLFMLLP
jgi:hypothetical protein